MHPIVEFLKEIDRSPGQSPRELLDTILRECRRFTNAEAGTIFLVRPSPERAPGAALANGFLEPMSFQNDALDLEAASFVVPVDEGSIAGYVASTGEALLIDDAYNIPPSKPYGFNTAFDASTGYRTHSVACIALRHQSGAVSAVVQLINRRTPARDPAGDIIAFDPEQAAFIAVAGVVMTGVIERARMLEELAAANSDLVARNARIEALKNNAEIALREAEKSDRAKSQFLSCIGHELKTPLNAIIGFSELLNNEGFGPLGHASYKGFAKEVSNGGHKLLGMVDDILVIVQAESASVECTDDGRAAYGCVEDTCRAWFDEAAEKNIVFAVEIADEPANCIVDVPRLTTILDRLTDNALKFTLAGGEIEVRARPKREGGLTIEISDTGVGMTDAEIVDALTPFGQADSTLSRLYEGAGLGLTLASALTRSMGAASQPELAALNTTWTPIISNPDQSFVSVDHARDLTGTTPSTVQGGSIGFPIFLLNDTKLADTYDDLWDGTIDNPFNVASDGSILFFRAVYTNSNADGTAAPYFMGGDPHAIGATNTTGPGWAIDGFGYLNMTPYSLYVISGLLIVPSESAAIPEPGSLSLLALGIVGLGYARRRRNA
jgi:signal transduction histidine kinase